MTQKKPGNFLVALLLSSLAFANPMMAAAKRTNPNKQTRVTITVDSDDTPATDPACCADTKVKAKADAPCADDCTVKADPADATRALAPAIAGGAIVTPVFEYAIKASDFGTPTASWTSGSTPTTGSVMYTINNSGRYYLASDVAARVNASLTNTVMLYINCSNVILDMNSKSLYPAGNTTSQNAAGMTAILLAPGISNVVIKNGTINGLQPNSTAGTPLSYICSGIVVSPGCKNLTISDVNIANIGGGALTPNALFALNPNAYGNAVAAAVQLNYDRTANSFGGTNVACANIVLQNVNVSNTANEDAGVATAGLAVFQCNNVQTNSCSFNSSVASGSVGSPNSYGAYVFNSNTLAFNDCSASQNGLSTVANEAIGFCVTGTTSAVTFANCAATQTVGTHATGFKLGANIGASEGNDGPYQLTNCSASNASGAGNTAGFVIGGLVNLTNCIAESNTSSAGHCYGVYLVDANGSELISCQANNNTVTAGTGQAAGFYFNNNDSLLVQACSANGNTGVGTDVSLPTMGFSFALCNSCRVIDCATGENTSSVAGMPIYGFYLLGNGATATKGISNMFQNCTSGHNYSTAAHAFGLNALVAGFYLDQATGTQFINCQARNNAINVGGDQAGIAAGFYSVSGLSNEFNGCQAINNACLAASSTSTVAGIFFVGETSSQITACNCSANKKSATSIQGIAAGVYLENNCLNNVIKDCILNFNSVPAATVTNSSLMFGLYDDAAVGGPFPTAYTGASSSVLINNRAAGHGRCFPLPSSEQPGYNGDYEFRTGHSMNYYFLTLDQISEDPNNVINETDNYNWKALSTALPDWSNISINIGQVS